MKLSRRLEECAGCFYLEKASERRAIDDARDPISLFKEYIYKRLKDKVLNYKTD